MAQTTTVPDFDSLKSLLLEIAHERSLAKVLDRIVTRLAEFPQIALARIWLTEPADVCGVCTMRKECPDKTQCLHLVASAGNPEAEADADWSRLDGRFRRIPIGVRKVGLIASSGEGMTVPDIVDDAQWIADPEWAEREGIRSFVGQPLVHMDGTLGVLAVFLRTSIPEEVVKEGSIWLRMIADHAAAAITNAHAFREIERLKKQLEQENAYLREEVLEAQAFGDIIGHSPALKNIVNQIELVAPTDANVLILGESGTGKELVAREIHRRSERAGRPMIRVNCASIPRDLYESEFFGHVKGAYTGAVKDREGRFGLADGGTLFMDEVGEIPLELQSKLLRVLQEGQYERVGEEKTRKVDVRIIAATNRDLKREVEEGRFRQDLFYRLNVFPVEVAPLRERTEDIPLLADKFLKDAAVKLKCEHPGLTQANVLKLQAYDWPGNVRELQNVIERAVITSRCETLRIEIPGDEGFVGEVIGRGEPSATHSGDTQKPESHAEFVSDAELKRRERDNILAALKHTGWKIHGADGTAELLGLKATTLASRIKKLGLKKND